MSSKLFADDPQAGARMAAMFTAHDREELAQLRAEKQMRQGQAGVDAIRSLAMFYLPPSTQEFAERHRMPAFVEEVWVQAFRAGWIARQALPSPSDDVKGTR